MEMENGKAKVLLSSIFHSRFDQGATLMRMYIADSIKEDYKQWKDMDTIFLSSPTGSGKTTFILNTYLPYLAKQKKCLLYLVNRTILKEQLEKEIACLPQELRWAIKIELYQTIENKFLELEWDNNGYQVKGFRHMREYEKYGCVVCDEAHYFLMDSNFNTNTIWSYNFVKELFSSKIRIYMSATIEQIRDYIKEDNKNNCFLRTACYAIPLDNRMGPLGYIWDQKKPYEYTSEQDYGYIDVEVLKSRDEIVDIVCQGTAKWLIFVDNKDFGKKLGNDIKKREMDKDRMSNTTLVSFITSDYKFDEEDVEQVSKIVEDQKTSAKILIATSVLDNGINIKDIDLRNVIIIADTKTEFIQMLGRKRKDNKQLKLYIYKHSKTHFIRRQWVNQKRLEIADKYYQNIYNHVFSKLDDVIEQGTTFANVKENKMFMAQHVYLMQSIVNNTLSFDDIGASFTSINGILYLNVLSFRNMENLRSYYQDILTKFDYDGEDAFIKEQLRWIGKTEDEINEIVDSTNRTKFEKSKERVISSLTTIEGKSLDKQEAILFKKDNKDDLLTLVSSVDENNSDRNKYVKSIKKGDRPISEDLMDFLRENCGISFRMEVQDSIYIIKRN